MLHVLLRAVHVARAVRTARDAACLPARMDFWCGEPQRGGFPGAVSLWQSESAAKSGEMANRTSLRTKTPPYLTNRPKRHEEKMKAAVVSLSTSVFRVRCSLPFQRQRGQDYFLDE